MPIESLPNTNHAVFCFKESRCTICFTPLLCTLHVCLTQQMFRSLDEQPMNAMVTLSGDFLAITAGYLHAFWLGPVHHLLASSTTSYSARWYLLKVPLTGQVRETSLQ